MSHVGKLYVSSRTFRAHGTLFARSSFDNKTRLSVLLSDLTLSGFTTSDISVPVYSLARVHSTWISHHAKQLRTLKCSAKLNKFIQNNYFCYTAFRKYWCYYRRAPQSRFSKSTCYRSRMYLFAMVLARTICLGLALGLAIDNWGEPIFGICYC